VLGAPTLLAATLSHKRFRIAAIHAVNSYVAGFGSDPPVTIFACPFTRFRRRLLRVDAARRVRRLVMPLSAELIAVLRHAARLGDAVVDAMVAAARPAVSEAEVYAAEPPQRTAVERLFVRGCRATCFSDSFSEAFSARSCHGLRAGWLASSSQGARRRGCSHRRERSRA
jgi:hypothetical protein